jgi:large subunit ribosomal protein L31
MKSDIHPTYHSEATVTCVCGNTFKVGSTKTELNVELCAQCHPFYTGKQKLVDTARRVEKFKERTSKKSAEDTTAIKKAKAAKRSAKSKESKQ